MNKQGSVGNYNRYDSIFTKPLR